MSDADTAADTPDAPRTTDELSAIFKDEARGARDEGHDEHEIVIAMRAAVRELAADGWEPDPVDDLGRHDGFETRYDGDGAGSGGGA